MRRAKRIVALATAVADIGGVWPLERVTAVLSDLAEATLSLAMAFTTNPFVVALNMPLMLWNAVPIARRMRAAKAARSAAGGSRWAGIAEHRPPISSSKSRSLVYSTYSSRIPVKPAWCIA